jgi:hypothetical protein
MGTVKTAITGELPFVFFSVSTNIVETEKYDTLITNEESFGQLKIAD